MRAYVDESAGGGCIAIGLVAVRGGEDVVRKLLLKHCRNFLSRYGIRYDYSYLKLSLVLNTLRRAGLALPAEVIEHQLILPGLKFLSRTTEAVRCVRVRDVPEIARILEEESLIRTFGAKIAGLACSLSVLCQGVEVTEIVLDRGFAPSPKKLRVALRRLGLDADIRIGIAERDSGLQLADFVAGACRRLARFNARLYIEGKIVVVSLV